MFIKGSDNMAEFNRKEFAERLKKFRKEKGLSQENLAMAIGKLVNVNYLILLIKLEIMKKA